MKYGGVIIRPEPPAGFKVELGLPRSDLIPLITVKERDESVARAPLMSALLGVVLWPLTLINPTLGKKANLANTARVKESLATRVDTLKAALPSPRKIFVVAVITIIAVGIGYFAVKSYGTRLGAQS